MDYFMRDGTRCPYGVWSELLADSDYCEIRSDELPNGTRIETCWLGVDGRSFYLWPRRIDKHFIFYTMVTFPKKGPKKPENQYFRYTTEREARKGHQAAVRKCKYGPARTGIFRTASR